MLPLNSIHRHLISRDSDPNAWPVQLAPLVGNQSNVDPTMILPSLSADYLITVRLAYAQSLSMNVRYSLNQLPLMVTKLMWTWLWCYKTSFVRAHHHRPFGMPRMHPSHYNSSSSSSPLVWTHFLWSPQWNQLVHQFKVKKMIPPYESEQFLCPSF